MHLRLKSYLDRLPVYLLVYLIQSVNVSSQNTANPCAAQIVSNNTDHVLPPIKNQYFARIDWREVSVSRSVYMEVYFDEPGQRSATRVTGFYDEGQSTTIIADYKNLMLYTIDDGCTKETMKSHDEFVFQHRTYFNGSGDLLNAHYALGLAGNLSYGGQDKIRDIPVDVWQGCYYDSGTLTTTWLQMYFSQPGWMTASGSTAVPVRKRLLQTTPAVSLENNYDYIYFQEFLPVDTTIFLLPKSSLCSVTPHTNHTRPILPQNFSFKLETVLADKSLTKYSNEWFDAEAGLVRIDSRDVTSAGYSYSRRQILDLIQGISYSIVLDDYSCDVTTLTTAQNVSDQDTIKFPQQFFNFSKNLKYGMQSSVRGMPVSVWYDTRVPDQNHPNQTALWTWYLSEPQWNMSSPQGVVTQAPVKVDISSSATKSTTVYNIYDFEEGKPDPSVFDVSYCYSHNDVRHIQFSMTGEYASVIAQKPKVMYDALRSYLQEQLGLSELQIQKLNIMLDYTGARVTFVLLGAPPVSKTEDIRTATDQVVMKLTSLIDSWKFIVRFQIYDGRIVHTSFSAVPNTLVVTMRNEDGSIVDVRDPTTPAPTSFSVTQTHSVTSSITMLPSKTSTSSDTTTLSSDQKGLPPGPVAGVALGTALFGLILGVIVTASICNQRSKKFADDDMTHQLTQVNIS